MNRFILISCAVAAICASLCAAEGESGYASTYSSSTASRVSFSSLPSSSEDDKLNAGAIAGIVICCVAFVVILGFAICCKATETARKGKIDPSIDEDDANFVSMSAL